MSRQADAKSAELFIVEGKSAKANLLKVIDRTRQTVHAVQGKLINVQKHSQQAVLADLECQQLIKVLDCGFDKTLDINRLPYSSVCILMDPDIDGSHSGALLLSLFDKYYQPLVRSGYLSLIKMPKFRIGVADHEAEFAWSEEDLEMKLEDKNHPKITRYKGVAQFSPAECEQFVLNPDTRRQFLLS